MGFTQPIIPSSAQLWDNIRLPSTPSFQFCHGPVFELTLPFYEKFEPIRSVLLTVTECQSGSVSDALDCFFLVFSDIFVVNEDKSELRLCVDYFNR